MQAAELTNPLYFDAVLSAKWKVTSSSLPEETIITQPQTEEEIHNDYENYVNQMLQNAGAWDLADYAKDNTYLKNGIAYTAIIQNSDDIFSLNFVPVDPPSEGHNGHPSSSDDKKKKPWWKL